MNITSRGSIANAPSKFQLYQGRVVAVYGNRRSRHRTDDEIAESTGHKAVTLASATVGDDSHHQSVALDRGEVVVGKGGKTFDDSLHECPLRNIFWMEDCFFEPLVRDKRHRCRCHICTDFDGRLRVLER